MPIAEVSDAQLVVAIARYREDALAECYRRHGGAVLALARRVTGDGGDAEDVVQEVFCGCGASPTASIRAAARSGHSYWPSRTAERSTWCARRWLAERHKEPDARSTAGAGYDIDREVWDAWWLRR